jgi:superfamily I DNA and/or RNA helicase
VDSHEGFDLNRSLFERLVRRGFPHQTLGTQHRMRPEISRLVRALTYPSLVDAPSTQGRPDVRGIRNNVVFIHHEHPEDDLVELRGFFASNEASPKSSKQNSFEVEMVLKIVRYLGQNGYSTNSIVLLTPYLGQLRALQQALRDTNDPILGDLDSADLVRAGLVSQAAATVSKQVRAQLSFANMARLTEALCNSLFVSPPSVGGSSLTLAFCSM